MTARLTKITVEQMHEGGNSAITAEVRDNQRPNLVLTETVRSDQPLAKAAEQAVYHGQALSTVLIDGFQCSGPPSTYGERL